MHKRWHARCCMWQCPQRECSTESDRKRVMLLLTTSSVLERSKKLHHALRLAARSWLHLPSADGKTTQQAAISPSPAPALT